MRYLVPDSKLKIRRPKFRVQFLSPSEGIRSQFSMDLKVYQSLKIYQRKRLR